MSSTLRTPILIVLAMMTVFSVSAEDWTTITSGWKPEHIVAANNDIWAVSEGGVLHLDPGSQLLEVLNVDNGLFSNFPSTVENDLQAGFLWIGHDNGGIDVLNPVNRKVVQTIRDFYNDPSVETTINDIFIQGDVIFVATNQGLSRLSRFENENLWVVLETYRGFGGWSRPTEITDVTLYQNNIFVGSDLGVAYADLDANLLDVSVWTTISNQQINPGIDTQGVQFLKYLDNVLYLGYYLGDLFKWDGLEFSRFSTISRAFDLVVTSDGTHYAGRGDGLFRKAPSDVDFTRVDDDYTPKFWGLTVLNDEVWAGIDTNPQNFGGIVHWDGSEFDFFFPNTPGGDQILTMATSPEGEVWVAARNSRIPGIYRLNNGTWYPYAAPNTEGAPWQYGIAINAIEFDSHGGTWIGTWGNSTYYIADGVGRADSLYYFDNETSKLSGVNPDTDFIVVNGFEQDPSGGLWMSNMEAHDENTLLYIPNSWFLQDPQTRDMDLWVKYGPEQGLNSQHVSVIEMDSRGRLWISSISPAADVPLILWDPRGTPTDPSDDEYRHFNIGDDIGFNHVNAMKMSADEFLWFGTPDGLLYLDTRLDVRSDQDILDGLGRDNIVFTKVNGALGQSITALTIDPLNQVWVGTDFGLSVLGRDKFTWIKQFTTMDGPAPSGLVENQITALTVDPKTGNVYVGTNKGLSVVTTPYRDFADELGTIEVAPQPFLVGNRSAKLRFSSTSLVADAEVRIITPSGRLVRSLSFQVASADGWDGRDDEGEWVGSGIYYIVVTDPEGSSQTGKVAVVRE
jgi:ligand-binding sensor domain-containing protein